MKIRELYRNDMWTGLGDLLPQLVADEQDFLTGLEAGVWERSLEEDWDKALEGLGNRLEGDYLRREAERLSAKLRALPAGDASAVEVLRQQGELLKRRARLTAGPAKANA
jgi:hypothetical protein